MCPNMTYWSLFHFLLIKEFGRKHANYHSFRLSYVTTYGHISNLSV